MLKEYYENSDYGRRGTRISELFPDIPKPLIPIEGVPVLEREIIWLEMWDLKISL